MDLTEFSIKEKTEEGILEQPIIRGVKLPIKVRILGSDSNVVKKFEREKMRSLKRIANFQQNKDIDEYDDETIDTLLESSDEGVIVRIGGVYPINDEGEIIDEPIVLHGEELKNDRASYKLLLSEIPDLKDWIITRSNNRANFFYGKKKN